MSNILSDYPDIIGVAIFPMIIAIFVFAFPLLIQTITRIDDKYGSTKLIETFRKDWVCKWYLRLLVTSVLTCIPWCLQLPKFWDFGFFNNFVDYSALIFVCIGTIGLVIMTFFIVNLIYIYYYPDKLFKRLKKQHRRTKNEKEKTLYFEAISKLLFYSINKADEQLARQLLEFYYKVFIKFRKDKEEKPIEYPQEYYDGIFEANELLCERKKKTISYFNDSTLFHLFLDEYQHTVISPKTYDFLWRLFIQSINYDREDFIVSYWKKAHQLCNLFMNPIYPDCKYQENKLTETNEKEVEKQKKIREAFLEFHYALGGLLLYKQKYKAIKEIINYTQQQPPKYVLVPERMEDVIRRYMKVSMVGGHMNPVYYEQHYPFPDISGVDADGIIQMWIKRYLSILFLRQYTLYESYTYLATLKMPNPPTGLSEMKQWNDELDSLDYFVEEYLSDKNVLKEVGLSELGKDNWFEDNNKEKPSDLIDKLKAQIDDSFEKTKQEQEIAPEKEKEFRDTTERILNQVFNNYSAIFNKTPIDAGYKSLFIGGRYQPMEKAGFATNQEICYANTDSITAEAVAMEFGYCALNAFILMKNKKYFFTEKDIFIAINGLNLDPNKFVIIAIGLNLEYFSMLHIEGLQKTGEKWNFNGIEVIDIHNYMNELVSQSLFIIRKEDLPSIVHNEVSQARITKYNLEKIDGQKNIYTSILDLNKKEYHEIKDEVTKSIGQEGLSKLALVCVDINVEVRYKLNAKCIQLKSFSQFDDRGTVNIISDVQSIWED